MQTFESEERLGLAESNEPVEARATERPAASGDALAGYLAAIRDIRVLTREESYELAKRLETAEREFRAALYAIPGTALAVLELWRERRAAGRTTGLLSAHARDASGTDWSEQVDRTLSSVDRLLTQRASASQAAAREALDLRIAKGLARADVSLETLFPIHRELRGLVAAPRSRASREARRRLGLDARGARAALGRADRALAAYEDARRVFVHHNLRLVVAVSKRFRNMGVPFEDLIQEGNLGLVRAVEKFDHRRGFRFSSYAVWWITQSLIRVIQNHSRTVRVPSHLYEMRYRLRSAEHELRQRLGRPPTLEELAGAIEVSTSTVAAAQEAMKPIASIHAPVPGTDDLVLEDFVPDEDARDPADEVDAVEVRGELARQLEALEPRERQILEWRFGLGGDERLTLAEVGERLGLSRERVRQLEARALKRLRREPGLARLGAVFGVRRLAS